MAPPSKPQVSEETIQSMLSVHREQLAVDGLRLQHAGKEIAQNGEIAKLQIEAKLADNKDERQYKTKQHELEHKDKQYQKIVGVIAVASVLVFSGWALNSGHVELVEKLGTAILSFFGGMFYGRSQKKPEATED